MNTPQETFDITLFGLRKQGKASVGLAIRGGACKYRGNDGCKCAAGFHMPDAVYSKSTEGIGVGALGRKYFPAVPVGQFVLMGRMQTAHDTVLAVKRAEALSLWEREMRDIANIHGLNYTEPT